MDENTTNEVSTPETPVDSWDNIDLSDVDMSEWKDSGDADNSVDSDADQHEEESESKAESEDEKSDSDTPAEKDTSESSEKEAEKPTEPVKDETFTLKYLGNEKTVNRDDVVTLAQKGMDYDRVKEKLSEYDGLKETLKTNSEKLTEYSEFLEEASKANNCSVKDYIENVRVVMLANKENISNEAAREKLQIIDERKSLEREKQALKAEKEAKVAEKSTKEKRDTEIQEFLKVYKDIKSEDIPKDVWAEVGKGIPLITAYTRYENKTLKEKLEAEKQTKKNKERTAGSMQSTGKDKYKSEIERDWYDDD